MLFRPSFCANCGEKIERADWSLLTSRRFCQVCESEYKGHDLIPRVIVGLGLLAGIFGFGSYLKSGSTGSDIQALRQPKKFTEQAAVQPSAKSVDPPKLENAGSSNTKQADNREQMAASKPTISSSSSQVPKTAVADEPMYFCGAATKKGTPCSRRVKGNTRCYQHVGMPSMMPAEKLRIQ